MSFGKGPFQGKPEGPTGALPSRAEKLPAWEATGAPKSRLPGQGFPVHAAGRMGLDLGLPFLPTAGERPRRGCPGSGGGGTPLFRAAPEVLGFPSPGLWGLSSGWSRSPGSGTGPPVPPHHAGPRAGPGSRLARGQPCLWTGHTEHGGRVPAINKVRNIEHTHRTSDSCVPLLGSP